MLSMVRAPGVITNKINTTLYRNHNHNKCRFCLPFPPFYADSSAELSQLQVVVVTSGAFTFTSVNIRKVPLEMLKTSGFALDFQYLPRDLANVNEWKIMFDPYSGYERKQ